MIMLISSPNMPSVKYNALLYNTETECLDSVANYLNYYDIQLAPTYILLLLEICILGI